MELKDNDNVKETRLDDSAEIYNKERSDSLEEGQFKSMSLKDKLFYFKEYYLNYLILALVIIIVSGYVIMTFIESDKKRDAFYCGMIGGVQLDEDTMKSLPEDFSNYLATQTDYSGYINADDTTFDVYYATLTDGIKLDGYYDQGKFDILILRAESFKNYVAGRTIFDLSTVLSPDRLKELDDRIVYVIDNDTGEEIPYGILLDNIKYSFQDGSGAGIDPPILTIPICTKRIDVARYFIDYILS